MFIAVCGGEEIRHILTSTTNSPSTQDWGRRFSVSQMKVRERKLGRYGQALCADSR